MKNLLKISFLVYGLIGLFLLIGYENKIVEETQSNGVTYIWQIHTVYGYQVAKI